MTRAADMNSSAELIPFGLVNVSGYGDYELNLPNDKSYTLWTFGGSGGTALIFKYFVPPKFRSPVICFLNSSSDISYSVW